MTFVEKLEQDVAFEILSQNGKPMFYKDLVMQVIEAKKKPIQSISTTISEVYTLINMDSRFSYVGNGMWTLTDWVIVEEENAASVDEEEALQNA